MHRIELIIERIIFQSRWALAPFYLGLVLSLLLLLYHFLVQVGAFVLKIPHATESGILGCWPDRPRVHREPDRDRHFLRLGEFVSDRGRRRDRRMTKVDFGGLKKAMT